jgi:Asp-tRNA(Asn)/Glu-tRNA(Gln) amidotransferase A subunit family amidase
VAGEDVLYLSVRELSERIRSRRLSPVELTEGYLDRSERIGAMLNAYAVVTRDLALREARQAEREIKAGKYRGPLHGIPYAAKDLLAVKGYPTTWGAAVCKSEVRLRRDRHQETSGRRIHLDWEGRDDRTGRGNGISLCFGFDQR